MKRGPCGTVGFDAGKQVKGRKRHILVDTMGLLLVVVVHSAGVQGRDGAKQLLQWAMCHLPRLQTIFADSAYVGTWHARVDYIWSWGLQSMCRFLMQVVHRAPGTISFKVLPKRWVVERTFMYDT